MRGLRVPSQIAPLRRRPSRLGGGQHVDRDRGGQIEARGREGQLGCGEFGSEADGVWLPDEEEGFGDGSDGEREEVEGDGEEEGGIARKQSEPRGFRVDFGGFVLRIARFAYLAFFWNSRWSW